MSTLTQEEAQLISDSVSRFVAENYRFEHREKRLKEFPFGLQWAKFAELGWLALSLDETVGGLGASLDDMSGILMAFGCGLVEEPYLDGIVLAAEIVERLGTHEQRDQILPAIATGERRLCLCHRESGSELVNDDIHTSFRNEGSTYVINGRKSMAFAAAWADTLLVSARSGTETAIFLVSATSPGLLLRSFPCADGSQAADVEFRSVEVDAGMRLGGADILDAWPVLKRSLLRGAAAVCMEAVGIAQALRLITADYLKVREQFGQPLAKFQALQHRFADMISMEMEISAAASMAATAVLDGDDASAEVKIRTAKARTGQLGRKIAEEAVQLHGGIGFTEEYIVGHYLRRMLVIDSRFGDSQEQLVWLAKGVTA